MVELKFLNKKLSFCQVWAALWNLLKQIGMGHLTKSLLPACSLAQLFISLGIVALGTIWVKIEVFEQKSVSLPCVHSASSLKFIETNWDGTPDKVLAACLLTRPTVHFTWHCCTRHNLGEDWGFWTKKCLLAMCAQRQLFEIYWNKLGWDAWQSPCRPPARSLTGVIYFTRHRCTRYNLGVVASCFF